MREPPEPLSQPSLLPHGRGLRGTLTRRQYWVGLAAFCLLFAGSLVSSLHRLDGNSGDFSQLIQDGEIARQTGQLDDALPLEYPPTARPLFIVLSLPPARVSLIFWWLLNAWMYWQSAVWLSRWIEPRGHRLSAIATTFAMLGLGIVGVVSDLSVGQLTGLVLFCVAAAFECDRVGRPIAAGAAWSLSLLIKPLPVVLLFYFVARRRWKLLASTGVSFLVLGPILLAVLFGWERQLDGWAWFVSGTAHDRSPLVVFERWAAMPGYCLTYRESGLASSLIRLFMEVTYDSQRNSVQIATLSPGVVRVAWFVLVGAPLCLTVRAAAKARSPGATFHAFAAIVGVAMLANPKLISYWLALPMICAAPLAARALAARSAGKVDTWCVGAIAFWLLSMGSLAIPAFRAAGSIPLGIAALVAANLVCGTLQSPKG